MGAFKIGFIFVYFVLQVLEVHLDFLLESDVAADGRFEFLGLGLKHLIVVETDKIGWGELEEVIYEVVGEECVIGRYFGFVAQIR